jgi:hypothetical protein
VSALGAIEDLLFAERSNGHSGMWYTSDHTSSVREMELIHIDRTEEDKILFVKGYAAETRQLIRRPVTTDVTVRSEFFRKGSLRESVTVSVEEFVQTKRHPFIARYAIERYVGDAIQATVARTDVLRGEGLDEREMLPYDFREFEQQVNVLVAIRKGLLLASRGSEDAGL